jgi:hypothetical protein
MTDLPHGDPRHTGYLCTDCILETYPNALLTDDKPVHRDNEHNWIFVKRLSYRDRDDEKFWLEVYTCECGAGHREYVPMIAWSL